MISIARASIEQPLYPCLLAILCLLGGWWGLENVGRLEDPAFPTQIALVVTPYPGASAKEVESEVTDVIETALQQLPQVEFITSKSVPGRSEVTLRLLSEFGSDETPQIWDEMRRRVRGAQPFLPPGARASIVRDDFGDVFGMIYAISGPDYSAKDQSDVARLLQREIKLEEGVAKVITEGLPREAVYVELSAPRLQRLGIPIDALFGSIGQGNQVVNAGSIAHGDRRLRIAPPPTLHNEASIEDLRIGTPGSAEIIRLGDIGKVSRETLEIPADLIRHNGQSVFLLAVSVTKGRNVVDVGGRVDARLRALLQELPLGFEITPITRQHTLVASSIDSFIFNLTISIATVIAALCLFMGWRAGVVVGAVLVFTVAGTLLIMGLMSINLQRISLGALMIAMGMLVDNAIVVAEGMITGVRRGLSPATAAEEATQRTQFALFGATVIGILAFAPIGLSDSETGHFLISLFKVVAISLLLSWVLAISLVPFLGNRLLKSVDDSSALSSNNSGNKKDNIYGGWGYAPYKGLLSLSLRHSWIATFIILGITASCLWGFSKVRQEFFPTNSSPLFFVDYQLPQGSDILTTSKEVRDLEALVKADPEVTALTSFIGRGTIRFAATITPEQPNPSYAHLLIRVNDVTRMDSIMARLTPELKALNPDAEVTVRRSEFSPGGSSKLEARFSGPDAHVLRALGEQATQIYLQKGLIDLKLDWRQRELQLVPRYNEERGRMSGVSRAEVYQSIAFSTLGLQVGLLRDGNDLLPIFARAPAIERQSVDGLLQRRVWSRTEQTYVPLSQVIDAMDLVGSDSQILRRDRRRTLTAQGNPPLGGNFAETFADLRDEVEAIPLPLGYSLSWGGEQESNIRARESLGSVIPATFGGMFIVTLLLFGRLKQTLVIWFTVPMIVCGVVITLLSVDMGFTFPAFLGFLSLAGMLIKNAVVLVDEIDKRAGELGLTLEQINAACVSRLRPVMLASGTTIAGMSPLLNDDFFREMAVCIMGGLAFSTLLTLLAIPVFYRLLIGPKNTKVKASTSSEPLPPQSSLISS